MYIIKKNSIFDAEHTSANNDTAISHSNINRPTSKRKNNQINGNFNCYKKV